MDFLKENLNTIIEGDCLEKLKDFPNRSVDFIFADPPYFMQTEGELKRFEGTKFQGVEDHWDKFGSFEEYDTFCLGWSKCSRPHRFLCSRPLKYRASFLKG
uniref:DNA methyltransferase n=1 Tax=Helicobacter pylori TaxID=210 RepID=UPI002F3F8C9E